MTLTPEFLVYKAADEASAKKILAEFNKSKSGIVKSYIGFPEEDPATALAVNLWSTKPPTTASTSTVHVCHPALDKVDEIPAAVESKAMQFLMAQMKPDVDAADTLGKLVTKLRFHEATRGSTWGMDINNGDAVAVLGWDSSKSHMDTVTTGDVYPQMITAFRAALVDFTVYHVPMKLVN